MMPRLLSINLENAPTLNGTGTHYCYMTNTTDHQQQRGDDDLLDAEQVASQELHGHVTPRTVESWRSPSRAQPLPYITVGRRRLYRRGDVRKFISDHRQNGAIGKTAP